MPNNKNKEQYAQSLSFFLAEELRTHKISLIRASEIAQKFLENISLVDTEEDFSRFVKSLAVDFDELAEFKSQLTFSLHTNRRREMEKWVREFVVSVLPSDMSLALEVLQTAIQDNIELQDLRRKFPQFNQFIDYSESHE